MFQSKLSRSTGPHRAQSARLSRRRGVASDALEDAHLLSFGEVHAVGFNRLDMLSLISCRLRTMLAHTRIDWRVQVDR